jgi:hypothetical protein
MVAVIIIGVSCCVHKNKRTIERIVKEDKRISERRNEDNAKKR